MLNVEKKKSERLKKLIKFPMEENIADLLKYTPM